MIGLATPGQMGSFRAWVLRAGRGLKQRVAFTRMGGGLSCCFCFGAKVFCSSWVQVLFEDEGILYRQNGEPGCGGYLDTTPRTEKGDFTHSLYIHTHAIEPLSAICETSAPFTEKEKSVTSALEDGPVSRVLRVSQSITLRPSEVVQTKPCETNVRRGGPSSSGVLPGPVAEPAGKGPFLKACAHVAYPRVGHRGETVWRRMNRLTQWELRGRPGNREMRGWR